MSSIDSTRKLKSIDVITFDPLKPKHIIQKIKSIRLRKMNDKKCTGSGQACDRSKSLSNFSTTI